MIKKWQVCLSTHATDLDLGMWMIRKVNHLQFYFKRYSLCLSWWGSNGQETKDGRVGSDSLASKEVRKSKLIAWNSVPWLIKEKAVASIMGAVARPIKGAEGTLVFTVWVTMDFPDGSAKESAWDAGDGSSIPRLGRSPGGGSGNLHQ